MVGWAAVRIAASQRKIVVRAHGRVFSAGLTNNQEGNVPPEVAENPQKSLEARLVEDEIKLVERVIKRWAGGYAAKDHLGVDPKHFVQHCLQTHSAFIERWNGWRWHSGVIQQSTLDETVFKDANHRIVLLANDLSQPVRFAVQAGALPAVAIQEAFRQKFWPHRGKGDITLGPSHRVQIRYGQSISRAVLNFVRKLPMPATATPIQVDAYRKAWDRMFELLGQGWKFTDPFSVTFSMAPSSFLRLGHYGEANSCMKFGSDQARGKRWLAAMPNSYVALAYKGAVAQRDIKPGHGRKGLPVYRGWGLAKLSQWAMYSNHYISAEATVRPFIMDCVKEAFNIADPAVIEDAGGELFKRGANNLFYTNGDARLVFPSKMTIAMLGDAKREVANTFKSFLDNPVLSTSQMPKLDVSGMDDSTWEDADVVYEREEAFA